MQRPNFEDISSYDEFKKYYWYLDELREICKGLRSEYVGNKAELNAVIQSYFDGVVIPHKPKRSVKSNVEYLSLDTGLIDCGFNFGPRFRNFFIGVTGDEDFKFTVDMVATAKAVKSDGDVTFTLGDLLDIKLGKKVYAVYDKSSCQWNAFLKDFCADEANNIYPDKSKAARTYWKILRESDLPKVYSREFIESNRGKIRL